MKLKHSVKFFRNETMHVEKGTSEAVYLVLINYLDLYIYKFHLYIYLNRGGNKERFIYKNNIIQDYFNRIDRCGEQMNIRGNTFIHRCKKQACHECGGENHPIHRNRRKAVHRRTANMSIISGRSLIFTVPMELRRKYFMSREGLNRLLKIVNRVIKKYFGIEVGEKKKKKGVVKIYRLDKPAIATLELFGKDNTYNPHINVIIFEKYPSASYLRISKTKLQQIKTSYKKALTGLLRQEIKEVVVHSKYVDNKFYTKKVIRYVTKPTKPETFEKLEEEGDTELITLLIQELKGFQYIRYWGKLSNCRYKNGYKNKEAA
jgi:hypothetical protein